ncbi:hypothetical protein EZ428_16265 [Pedobacter frigiditerrae]|uniref:YD repeat-containing protein n=1 Tax=Pedobacter frigiditerrae TaxID=2530452 RepID=A0A4R0MQV8_9SPHI|nr:hypothetical protein [Pedobacter frigiditerrae]TCC89250.1 hypothetical protein EZ428_16265 [Pedobacter frigiditerrae]
MKTKILMLLCVVMFTSCKKNRNAEPVAEQKTYLSKLTTYIGAETWSYDTQNKPTSMVFASTYEPTDPSYTYKINILTNEGAVIDAVYDYVSTLKPDIRELKTYNIEGKLIRTTLFINATGLSEGYTTYEYLVNEIKSTTYNTSNSIISSALYTKSADGKNIVEIKKYNGTGSLQSRATYSNFDNKKSYALLYPVGYGSGIINSNNYLTVVFFNAGIGTTNTTNYTYEYNTDGYATKRVMVGSNTETFEYIKK